MKVCADVCVKKRQLSTRVHVHERIQLRPFPAAQEGLAVVRPRFLCGEIMWLGGEGMGWWWRSWVAGEGMGWWGGHGLVEWVWIGGGGIDELVERALMG